MHIEAAAHEIHETLRTRAAGLSVEGIDPVTLRGLCATGAVLLRDRLLATGHEAHLVAARSVFGNVFHYWVLCEGVHADPTFGQFDAAQPVRVSHEAPRLVFGDWHDKPTTWAVEPSVVDGFQQHPSRVLPLLGLAA